MLGGSTMKVSEIFTSIQGEGPYVGTPCVFLRLQGCNLRCSKENMGWDCDTPYAISRDGGQHMTVDTVVNAIISLKHKHLVITGGEPMLQQEAIAVLLTHLDNHTIEIETNGTIPISGLFPVRRVRFNVSPKYVAIREEYVKLNTIFKFVVNGREDLTKVDEFVERYNVPHERVYLMPQGIDADEIVKKLPILWSHSLSRGYRVTPRLHIITFGTSIRGV
jgi:7-carboxy-7-deazaguanine synthase